MKPAGRSGGSVKAALQLLHQRQHRLLLLFKIAKLFAQGGILGLHSCHFALQTPPRARRLALSGNHE